MENIFHKYFRISQEGIPFIFPFLILFFLFLFTNFPALAILSFLIFLLITFFFRDPERSIPPDDQAILSPADGKVIEVEKLSSDPLPLKISIFLSLFDVHVTRSP